VAGLAEWGSKGRIAISACNMMLLNSDIASAKQATILILTPGQSSGRIDWILVHHDEDSGRA
jgi:hypothetical protein